MSQRYCLDTSAFINAWAKHYSPDVFPSLWKHLETLSRTRVIMSCEEVYREIEKQHDGLCDWAKRQKQIFERPTSATTRQMQIVMGMFPNLAAQGGATNAADPWVISHAKLAGATLVTYEQRQEHMNPRKPPKIPNVCEALNVPWLGMADFLKAIDFRI